MAFCYTYYLIHFIATSDICQEDFYNLSTICVKPVIDGNAFAFAEDYCNGAAGNLLYIFSQEVESAIVHAWYVHEATI